jgi:hypothetical protein
VSGKTKKKKNSRQIALRAQQAKQKFASPEDRRMKSGEGKKIRTLLEYRINA